MAIVRKSSFALQDQYQEYQENVRKLKEELAQRKEANRKEIHKGTWIGALLGSVFLLPVFPIGAAVGGWLGYRYKLKKITGPIQREIDALDRDYIPVQKGYVGEEKVSNAIQEFLPDDYVLLNDITIPSWNGRSTQIDHVLIGPNRIYVIETKNIRGIYYPHKDGKWLWYPVISYGKVSKETVVDSPQGQSIHHAKWLNTLLNKYNFPSPIQPMVVLTHPQTQWRGNLEPKCPVVHLVDFINFIKTNDSNQPVKRNPQLTEKTIQLLLHFTEKEVAKKEKALQNNHTTQPPKRKINSSRTRSTSLGSLMSKEMYGK